MRCTHEEKESAYRELLIVGVWVCEREYLGDVCCALAGWYSST